jgi:hypothetical protein
LLKIIKAVGESVVPFKNGQKLTVFREAAAKCFESGPVFNHPEPEDVPRS